MTRTSAPLVFSLPSSVGERLVRSQAHVSALLGNALGRPVQLQLADTYAALARDVLQGRAQLAWAPPLIAARLEVSGGKALLRAVRRGAGTYRAALVCAHDRPVDPARLSGLRAAWVERDSAAGHVLARAWIRERGSDPDVVLASERFCGSYRAAVDAVLGGAADLASVFATSAAAQPAGTFLDELPPATRSRLEIVGLTEEVPNDCVVAGPALSGEELAAVTAGLSRAFATEDGARLARMLFSAESFEPCPEGAYRVLCGPVLASMGLLASPRGCIVCGWELSLQARFCERCGQPTGRGPGELPSLPPPRTAIATTQRAAPAPTSPTWSEERRLATILFADLAGFTAISSTLEPEAVREFANTCFEPLAREIEGRGGTVIKYIGDCVMAAFGVPRSGEDDARRAVEAGLAMTAGLADLSAQIQRRYGAPISMRIGINTGLVMVGSVGGGGSAALDVMGAAVNLASRIQGAGHPGQVVIGPATCRLVERHFALRPLGAASLKGINEQVPLFEVVGEREDAAPDALDARFSLRDEELATLLDAFDQAVASRGLRAAKLVGEAGLGRGFVMGELRKRLGSDPRSPSMLRASGVVGTSSIATPLRLFSRLVRGRFGVRADEPASEARTRIVAGVAEAWAPFEREEGLEAAAILADLAAPRTDASAPALATDDPSFARDRVYRALLAWLERLALRAPVCLMLEELQWADEASLELLERLVRGLSSSPVFAVFGYRPELEVRHPSWCTQNVAVERVPLNPVAPAAMRRFVDFLLARVPELPSALRDELVTRSEGNPSTARELVRLLVDRGAIETAGPEGRWLFRAEKLGALALPQTVQGVLQARLDGLPVQEKELLKRASVVGRSFWSGALEPLSPDTPREQLSQLLPDLERRGFVAERKPPALEGEREYAFRSQALRDIAYDSIPRPSREVAHRRVAEWLETRGKLWDAVHAELAGHLEAGGAPERARVHYLAAARAAVDLYANREAASLYERALSLWPETLDRPVRAEAERELAAVLGHVGRFEDALRVLESAERTLADTDASGAGRAAVELERARILKEYGRVEAAIAALDRGIALSASAPPSTVRMVLHGERAFLRAARHESAAAREDCAAGLSTGEGVQTRDAAWRHATAMLTNILGGLYFYEGRFDEAESAFRQALSLGGASSRGKWVALVNLGAIAFQRQAWMDAGRHFEHALALARKTQRVKDVATCLNNLGQAELASGQAEAAVAHLTEARQLSKEADILDVLADSACALASARLAAGDARGALHEARSAVELARRSGLPWFEATAHATAMDCLLAGAPSEGEDGRLAAARHLQSAVEILRQSNRAGRDAEIAAIEARFKSARSA